MGRLCIQALVLTLLLLSPLQITAQPESERPLVGFIIDDDLAAASPTENNQSGLSELADIFRTLGAQVQTVVLGEPLSADLDVVVLVHPLRRLSSLQLSNLWDYLQSGKNLLLAFDPNEYAQVRTERATDGLNRLLETNYGLSLDDGMLIENWFTTESLAQFENTLSVALPENFVVHAIAEPLLAHQLPVYTWASRPVTTHSLGLGGSASPLVYSETAFAEVGDIFARERPAPIRFNPGIDRDGRIHVGGAAENRQNGSRIVLLGDSEILINAFGLAGSSAGSRSAYVGNRVLAERIAAWLLELPSEQWPPLPQGYTWIRIDGDGSDWDEGRPQIEDAAGESDVEAFDIQRVRAFHNDQFSYLMVETAAPPDANVVIDMRLQQPNLPDVNVLFAGGEGYVVDSSGNLVAIPDARAAYGDVIELRLPLRVGGLVPQIAGLCLMMNDTSLDCMDETFAPRNADELAPVTVLASSNAVLAIAKPEGTSNVRSGPGLNFSVIGSASPGTVLAITGRDESATWMKVETGRYSGWIALSRINLLGDIQALEVVA